MGEGQVSASRAARSDDDAPWRPDFGGWTDDLSGSPPGGARRATSDVGVIDGRAPAAVDERWSREHDLREREPWRPEPRTARHAPPIHQPTGPPVAAVDGQPDDVVTGQLVLTGIVIAALVAAAIVAIAVLRPATVETPAERTLPVVPVTVETLWTATLDSAIDQVGIGTGRIVVSLAGRPDLVALDLATGAELWRRPADLPDRGADAIDVIGDRVVVERRGPGGAPGVTVLDGSTGDVVWSADDGASYRTRGAPDRRYLVRLSRRADVSQLEVVDPVDGTVVAGPVPVSAVSVAGEDVVAQGFPGDRVGVWSVREGVLVAGPVPAFNLRTVAADDGAVVALDLDRRIVAFASDGERLDERPFESDAFGEFRSRAELVGVVADAGVGIVSSGSSLGFRVSDGRIETVWQRPGRAGAPVQTEVGPVSVLVGPTGASGEIDDTLIDPRTGGTLVVTDAGTTRETEPLLGHNAYVAAPEVGAAERLLQAFSYEGDPLWQLALDPAAAYHVTDDVVVVIERRPNGSTIVAAG